MKKLKLWKLKNRNFENRKIETLKIEKSKLWKLKNRKFKSLNFKNQKFIIKDLKIENIGNSVNKTTEKNWMAAVFKNIEEIYKKIKTIRKENSNKAIIRK